MNKSAIWQQLVQQEDRVHRLMGSDLLAEQGLLPPMPPRLREAQGAYSVVYTSPLSRAAKAQEAGATLSNVGGGVAGNGKITVETLVNMDDASFREWWKKNGDEGLRKVQGAN